MKNLANLFARTILVGTTLATLAFGSDSLTVKNKEIKRDVTEISNQSSYSFKYNDWKNINSGMDYMKVVVYEKFEDAGRMPVDSFNVVRIDPEKNKISVHTDFDAKSKQYNLHDIEEWQEKLGTEVVINSLQYMADPYGYPCAFIKTEGKPQGPKKNKSVRGILLSEPSKENLPKADLIDLAYTDSTKLSDLINNYDNVVSHWPILLNKNGEVKVNKSDWEANRTVVAEDRKGNILFITSEGQSSLYNFGTMLKFSKLDIETALNMDGGYEACMAIKTPTFQYTTFGQWETQGRNRDISIPGIKIMIPGVISASKRE